MPSVLRAGDYFAALIREQSRRRLQDATGRADVEAAGRLIALACWFESLDWDGDEAKLLDAAAPSRTAREFPRLGTRQLLDEWESGQTNCPLHLFARILIEHEVRARLDAELAAL
jgi:hypothetical protein